MSYVTDTMLDRADVYLKIVILYCELEVRTESEVAQVRMG